MMGGATYYKAVRPDLTDFTTGETKLVLGEWMPDIEGDLRICFHGYHVSTTPSETLQSGNGNPVWPARLFAVEARGVGDFREWKAVCQSYRAIEELPAWQAFGPNGQEVMRFLEACRRITKAQVTALRAVGYAMRREVRLPARAAVRRAARLNGRTPAADVAQQEAENAFWEAAGETTSYSIFNYAMWVAGNTAFALVVRDLIPPETFDTLVAPATSALRRTWKVTP